MRHRVFGKRLSRTTSHRRAMRRNMAASLIQHGAIRTTEVKAKQLRPFIERMITIAKKGTLHARRRVLAELGDRSMTDDDGEFLQHTVVQKLFDEVAPGYADRPGGYTRIIRLDEHRIGDAGSQVILQLVTESPAEAADVGSKASRRKRRAARRHEAAAEVDEKPAAEKAEEVEESKEPQDVEESQENSEASDEAEESTEATNADQAEQEEDK